jgi:hypothetical protein
VGLGGFGICAASFVSRGNFSGRGGGPISRGPAGRLEGAAVEDCGLYWVGDGMRKGASVTAALEVFPMDCWLMGRSLASRSCSEADVVPLAYA